MLNQEWQNWVHENLARGCDRQELREILAKNNFTESDISTALSESLPDKKIAPPLTQGEYKMLYEYPAFCLGKFPGARYIANPKLQLYVIDDLLTSEECDQTIALSNTAMRPSTLTVYAEGFRTSSTGDLHIVKDPFIEHLEKKLASALDINPSYAEFSQAQKYLVGQEFKPHTDYFEPGTPEFEKFGGPLGQRTWTLMVYLNETTKGGGTQFVNLGLTFYPKKGRALVWNNLYPNGMVNPDSQHWGMPVEDGEKIIITKWFREQGHGSMFESV